VTTRALALAVLVLAGCASTTTARLVPSPQPPVCQRGAAALVLWAPQWRADQKDVPAREAAAEQGLDRFFATSGCFASVVVRRVPPDAPAFLIDALAEAQAREQPVVVIAVRELGPTLAIGASLALVEGGTEVVLDVTAHEPAGVAPRKFSVQWRTGGAGVIKGVASLPQDLQAALAAGLQPAAK
jgi:hypothetical protein